VKAVFEYSHLGGAEILRERYPDINAAIDEAIVAIGDDFRTFVSGEGGRRAHNLLYAPAQMNRAFRSEFNARGFRELKRFFEINVPGWKQLPHRGYKQVDFARDRVLVEVQLGKYFAMFYDMAKLEYFYRQNLADVGVEIVPSHALQAQMSSGVGRGEMLLVDIIALQRSFPTFPVKVILIEPEGLAPPVVPEVAADPVDETA
jgi:hypothetical protein